MKEYKVEITDEALADMEQLYSYIANVLLSPQNAMGQYNRIAAGILSLSQMPERFRILDSEFGRSMGLRRMLVDRYSIFYVVEQERVVVTAVLYSASDLDARLKRLE
jgi:toxin ParE1/3/4